MATGDDVTRLRRHRYITLYIIYVHVNAIYAREANRLKPILRCEASARCARRNGTGKKNTCRPMLYVRRLHNVNKNRCYITWDYYRLNDYWADFNAVLWKIVRIVSGEGIYCILWNRSAALHYHHPKAGFYDLVTRMKIMVSAVVTICTPNQNTKGIAI